MRRLANIQHLRAIGALIVVFSHLVEASGSVGRSSGRSFAIGPIAGTFGVDIFFIISGFIMYYTSAADFGKIGATADFLRRRLIRVVPIYWLLTTVSVAILWVSRLNEPDRQIDISQILKSYLFIPYVSESGKYRPLLAVGWSLQYELLFYLAFGAALLLARRAGVALLFAFFASLIAFGAIVHPTGALGAWTMPVSIEFLAGVLIAIAFYHRPAWVGRVAAPSLAISLALVLAQHFLVTPMHYLNDEVLWRPQHWLWAAIIVAAALVCRQSSNGNVFTRTMTRIGDSSYSLYLTHSLIMPQEVLFKLKLDRYVDPYVFFFGAAALAIAVGWFFHIWVEKPLTRYLTQRLTRRPPPVGMASVGPLAGNIL